MTCEWKIQQIQISVMNLQFSESSQVTLEVGVVDLAHRVDVLVTNLLRNLTFMCQQKLSEEPSHNNQQHTSHNSVFHISASFTQQYASRSSMV